MIGYFSSLPPLGLMKPWGDGSRHRHGGPSCSGKMACGLSCKGATRVAHTAGETRDGTNCSVRLHRRDTVARYREAPPATTTRRAQGPKPGEPGSYHEQTSRPGGLRTSNQTSACHHESFSYAQDT